MAVSFLDGKYVKQMTTSLEEITEALNTLNGTFSSSGDYGDINLDNALILERNIASQLIWSSDSDQLNKINSNVFDIKTSKNYVIFMPNVTLDDLTISVNIFDTENAIVFTETFTTTTLNNITVIHGTNLGPKMQLSIISANFEINPNDYVGSLFIAEVISSANLSDVEKAYIREKIGAGDDDSGEPIGIVRYDIDQTTGDGALTADQQQQARANIGLGNINGLVTGTVKYSEQQSLGDSEKIQARQNIGAASEEVVSDISDKLSGWDTLQETVTNISTAASGAIRYDIDQATGDGTLTVEQQQQARANIGLGDINSLVTGTVKYSGQQSLNVSEQSQARQNIGAASNSDVNDIALAIAGMEKNVTNIIKSNDGKSLIVEYADNSFSDPITVAAGQKIGSISYDDDYMLHILDENGEDIVDPIKIYGGGGGTAVETGTAEIIPITDNKTPVSFMYRQPSPIRFSFRAVDADDEPVGNGRGTWKVDGVTVASNVTVRQGVNEFDISNYLNAGENTVQLSVAVNVGGFTDRVSRKTWTVNAVDMRFTWNYNDAQINTKSFTDNCVVYGGVLKTIHTIIDEGTENEIVLDTIQTTKSNVTQLIEIPMLSHGAHGVKRWLTATVGSSEEITPVQYHEMVFVEDNNTSPIIAVSKTDIAVSQYDTVSIPIYVYDPASLTTDIDLYVDDVKVGSWNDKDRTVDYWTYSPTGVGNGSVLEYDTEEDDSGSQVQIPSKWQNVLKIVCGEVEKEVPITVNRLKLNASEVPGYDFKFKASEFINNNDVINWSHTTPDNKTVNLSFSENFDWVNGGLQTETVDEELNETNGDGSIQQYFSVKAGTTMTINFNPFKSKDVKETGMTFKFVFKVKNCRKYNAEFAKCYDESNNTGIRLFAHNASFSSIGQTVNIQYDEDQYTELEFDVYPSDSAGDPHYPRYIMGWLDGVISICRVYEATDIFRQDNNSSIIIGSPDCDVNVYLVKTYSFLIDNKSNFDNHISNFIMDAPNGQQMLKRFNRNDILDDNGDISYAKLADRNPDLRIWLYDIPYMTNGKKDRVPVSYEQIWKNGSNYYQMHGTGKMSVQGTSSVGYIRGAANTDINFTSLYDGNNNDLLANGTQDDRFGNNWYYEDPENVGHAKEFSVLDAKIDAGVRKAYTPQQAISIAKVNDVSLLGSEWVAYKVDANDVPTLYINTNDSDDPEKTLGAEWIVIERDSNRNPVKYIKALGMKLNDNSCPITYSNTKVNFASCEQVNNMCNAAWYQRYTPYPSITARDCMEFNMGVQFIKDGAQGDSSHFALFDNTTKYNMYSIANMGTSKKNVHIFHDLSNPLEVCIEVKDNTEDQMRMISSDMSLQDWTGDNKDGKKSYYEMRYPDTSNPDALNPNITSAWYGFVEWMASSNPYAATNEAITAETYEPYTFSSIYHDRPGTPVLAGLTISRYAGTYTTDSFERRMAKMLSQCEQHMVMDSFVYHYIYLTRHTMVDNVSKNNFWSSTDLQHWDLSKAYDMDTSDGNDNQGKLVFDYGLEFDDTRTGSTQMVFNGSDSVWFRFVANLPEACERMFQDREAEGAWSSSEYHKFLTGEQHKVPERCWNQTYWYDYLRTHEDTSLNSVDVKDWILYLDGGQKIHQRQHYEKFQELFLSSKYHGLASGSQAIRLYAYAPSEWGGIVIGSSGAQLRQNAAISASLITNIPLNTKVTVLGTETADNGVLWKRVRYGNYTGYAQASQVDSIDPKGEITLTMYNKMYISVENGTVVLPPVKVEGDTPYTFTFNSGVLSNAIVSVNTASMITKLTGVEQLYCNNVSLGNAYRLREVSIGSDQKGYYNQNLTDASFSANRMLEKIYAQNLINVNAPLSLLACSSLEYLDTTGSGFTNYEFAVGGNLETAILQAPVTLSMKNLQQLTNLTILDYSRIIGLIIENCPNIADINIINEANALTYVRLIGIHWELSNSDLLNRLYELKGYNENNVTSDQSILAGYAHPSIISNRQYNNFTAVWPDLNIDLTNSEKIDELVVRFVDSDGTPLLDRNGKEYVQYIVRGEDAYDPIIAGELDAPSNKETEQYIYTFSGWDNIPTSVIFDATVTAVYDQEAQVYTVSWYNDTIESADTLLKSVTATYGEEVLYDPENENNYPTRTEMEHLGVYRVFKGWDNSTGFIRGNTKVHAIFESGSISNATNKKISQLSVAEICAVAKSGNAASFWTSKKDYADIKVGRDFNFGNVESQVLLENKFFSGNTTTANQDVVRFPDIKLFSADARSFTLVIDYEFTDVSQNAVLASCIATDLGNGFRLEYSNNNAQIVWGDQAVNISKGNNRGIVALRHRKGSKSLYVYSDNNGERGSYQTGQKDKSETEGPSGYRYICYNKNYLSEERARAQTEDIDSILSFGANASINGVEMNSVAKGWIHFAKIWYDDLGDTTARQLAYWPHETWRMHYSGSGIYNQAGSGANTNASFIANAALPQLYKYYEESADSYNLYNDGGWTDSALRALVNDKCYKALPVDWLSMLLKVYVKTARPNDTQNSIPITTEDYITIPARVDVINNTDSRYTAEGRTAALFDETGYNRAKFAGIIVPNNAKYFTNSSSDPTNLEQASVAEGDVWITDGVAYVYISKDTASKHYIIGGREVSNSANKTALGDQGGMWIRAYAYWLRTPATDRTHQYQVDANGDVNDQNMAWLSPYANMRAIVLQFSI